MRSQVWCDAFRLAKIKKWIDENDTGAMLIPLSVALESKLVDMPDDERQAYCATNKVTSALGKIITTGFKSLQLQYFFTAGKDEVKAWTIQVRGAVAIVPMEIKLRFILSFF